MTDSNLTKPKAIGVLTSGGDSQGIHYLRLYLSKTKHFIEY